MATVENPFAKARQKLVTARIEFMAQLARFSADELELTSTSDEWSPLQLAFHLYITEGLIYKDLQRVQNEDNPEITASEEEGPRQTEEAGPPPSLDAVLAGMAARREEIFEYLAALPVEAWERPLHHPHWGQLKFYQIVNLLVSHDQQHTQQLKELYVHWHTNDASNSPPTPTLS